MTLVAAEPVEWPCEACAGTGDEWPLRADGEPDRRYRWPVGPCLVCGGSGEQPPEDA